uniref:Uncharacterized protein n=1 Tax=Arundo donax TaxID=35708 RepID=A0A0A9B9W1_ARUDO
MQMDSSSATQEAVQYSKEGQCH